MLQLSSDEEEEKLTVATRGAQRSDLLRLAGLTLLQLTLLRLALVLCNLRNRGRALRRKPEASRPSFIGSDISFGYGFIDSLQLAHWTDTQVPCVHGISSGGALAMSAQHRLRAT